MPNPSWLAGYRAGLIADPASLVTVVPHDYCTPIQRTAFAGGFGIGAKDRNRQALIEELQREFE